MKVGDKVVIKRKHLSEYYNSEMCSEYFQVPSGNCEDDTQKAINYYIAVHGVGEIIGEKSPENCYRVTFINFFGSEVFVETAYFEKQVLKKVK